MGNFSVYGTNSDTSLVNRMKVLKRCEESSLVLNWQKCHFIVIERVVLSHIISE